MNDYKSRFAALWPEVSRLFCEIYPRASSQQLDRLKSCLHSAHSQRNVLLQKQDAAGDSWYQGPEVVAMSLYTDLFAQNFEGVKSHIQYFEDLGINLIHFMPLLKPREGENDGGYAVADYRETDSRLGTMEQFVDLVAQLSMRGIRSCVDFVINHTAKEHPWALEAQRGDPVAQGLYYMFETEEIPQQYEKTVPQVFPGVAPGNFTWYPRMKRWVFTSFYEFQWDLNYQNPLVLERIVETLLYLANQGISMIRLDAIPFIWKELGTTCRNLPTIHLLLKILHQTAAIVCPSVVLLGEAIVEPQEIVKYFGDTLPECPVMYNATGMVNLWNSLATRNTHLLYADHDFLPLPKWATWVNYARCHDDIGWGFNEGAIAEMGLSPQAHKQFLIHFYGGAFEGSFSKGELYEYNPTTQDARNTGTLASLCGLERALEQQDPYQRELALKRIQLVHSFLLAGRGIPLIYGGDELATINQYAYKGDERKGHDSRWLHRISMDWKRAQKRITIGTSENTVFQDLKARIQARKNQPLFRSTVPAEALRTESSALFVTRRHSKGQELVCLFNFCEDRQVINIQHLRSSFGFSQYIDLLSGKKVNLQKDSLVIGPYESLWLVPVEQKESEK